MNTVSDIPMQTKPSVYPGKVQSRSKEIMELYLKATCGDLLTQKTLESDAQPPRLEPEETLKKAPTEPKKQKPKKTKVPQHDVSSTSSSTTMRKMLTDYRMTRSLRADLRNAERPKSVNYKRFFEESSDGESNNKGGREKKIKKSECVRDPSFKSKIRVVPRTESLHVLRSYIKGNRKAEQIREVTNKENIQPDRVTEQKSTKNTENKSVTEKLEKREVLKPVIAQNTLPERTVPKPTEPIPQSKPKTPTPKPTPQPIPKRAETPKTVVVEDPLDTLFQNLPLFCARPSTSSEPRPDGGVVKFRDMRATAALALASIPHDPDAEDVFEGLCAKARAHGADPEDVRVALSAVVGGVVGDVVKFLGERKRMMKEGKAARASEVEVKREDDEDEVVVLDDSDEGSDADTSSFACHFRPLCCSSLVEKEDGDSLTCDDDVIQASF